MTPRDLRTTTARCIAGGFSALVAGYATCAARAWFRYGQPRRERDAAEHDALLDRFVPTYEVAERHAVRVNAPAEIAFAAACEVGLMSSPIVRGIFRLREIAMRAHPAAVQPPRGLLAQVQSIGWGVLAEIPGREVILGAVTQPWQADVTFRALAPDQFAAFDEPGYVKIAFTLRADPIGPGTSISRTETRVATTDPTSRARFRRYWAMVSAGVTLIRLIGLQLTKANAERSAAERYARHHRAQF